ncbi:MAG TPA: hypothetical protein DIC34_01345 [Treponema sp.]|nr:hypothetical protein [Treponema sp.]
MRLPKQVWSSIPSESGIPIVRIKNGSILCATGMMMEPYPVEENGRSSDDAFPGASMNAIAAAGVRIQAEILRTTLPGLMDVTDSEYIHDSRIAIRRIRVYLKLRGLDSSAKRIRKLDSRLRKLGRRLGAIRDYDVLLHDARNHLKKLVKTRADGFSVFIAAFETRRSGAIAKLRQRCTPQYMDDLLASLVRFTDSFGREMREVPPRPAGLDAPSVVSDAYAKVLAFEPLVRGGEADHAVYHAIRRSAKRFRYTLEIFEPLLGPESQSFIDTARVLQDFLGSLNDAATVSRVAALYVSDRIGDGVPNHGAPDPFPEVARFLGTRQERIHRLLSNIPQKWAKFSSPLFRKRLFMLLGKCPISFSPVNVKISE